MLVKFEENKRFIKLINFDKLFESDPNNKSIVSAEQIHKDQAKEFIKELFMDGSDELDFVASCEQGCTTGNYYLGNICPKCKTIVRLNFINELKFRAWLSIPEYIPPVLHPVAYEVIKTWLGSYQRRSRLDSLLDVNQPLPPDLEGVIGQGFTYFYNNFDDIMNYFLTQYKPLLRKAVAYKSEDIPLFLSLNKDALFTRHLPILNNSLHLLTTSGDFRLSDDSGKFIIKSLIELSDISYSFLNRPKKGDYIDKRLKTAYDSYIDYRDSIISGPKVKGNMPKKPGKIASKKGFIRKYMLGCRYHFSYRAVIVPKVDFSYADELHLPWRIGVTGLKLEILNRLQSKYNMNLSKALYIHYKALNSYVPEVHTILKQLIKECPYKGLPTLFNRNPSLRHGNVMLLFATIFKPDIDDNTISISPLIATPFNFDFDGDAMNGIFIKEMGEVPSFMSLHPETVMLTGDKLEINNDIKLTKQSNINMNAWLKGEIAA